MTYHKGVERRERVTAWLTRKAKFGTFWAEAAGWIGVFIASAGAAAFWHDQGYWIWKADTFAGSLAVMGSGMFGCMAIPLLAICLPIAIWKKKYVPDLIRVVQFVLPMTALSFAVAGTPRSENRDVDFKAFREERERVVANLRSKPALHDGLPIHIHEEGAAARNQVYVYQKKGEFMVFFPLLLYAIDNHHGFVYSETGSEPPRESFLETVRVERLDPHWFWIGTT